jgi:hypothetical protein
MIFKSVEDFERAKGYTAQDDVASPPARVRPP